MLPLRLFEEWVEFDPVDDIAGVPGLRVWLKYRKISVVGARSGTSFHKDAIRDEFFRLSSPQPKPMMRAGRIGPNIESA